MAQEKFHYKTLDEVKEKAAELGVHIPLSEDVSVLSTPLELYGKTLPNRMAIAPMEGNDSDEKGFPTEATVQRYINYAKGGASIIWFEAVAVVPEGRSGKHQLMLNEETLPAFKTMVERVKKAGLEANGYEPYLINQANHSGRYSRPNGTPEPIIAYHHPVYEATAPLSDSCIATDEYLDELVGNFGKGTELSKRAGFDAVDIKSCHGYLYAELASAYTREGKYGGNFENRFRLLIDSIKAALVYQDDNFKVTARIGIYDGFAYPYGWGMSEDGSLEPDFTEPVKLIKLLKEELGIEMINITMGNPYQNSHVTRPFDYGKYEAPEHPFVGLARMFQGVKAIKQGVPDVILMASAPTYLRQFSPNLAAGIIDEGSCELVNFGRLSFADPNFPNEITQTGGISTSHVCTTCGKCGDLIRAGYPCGCVIRNPSVFLPYYRELMEKTKNQ